MTAQRVVQDEAATETLAIQDKRPAIAAGLHFLDQPLNVVQQQIVSRDVPSTPACQAVAALVVRQHSAARAGEVARHVFVSPRMLTDAVNNANHAPQIAAFRFPRSPAQRVAVGGNKLELLASGFNHRKAIPFLHVRESVFPHFKSATDGSGPAHVERQLVLGWRIAPGY